MAAGLVLQKGSLYFPTQILREIDSNVTLAKGDLVNVQANQLEVADAGEVIAGVVQESATSSSTAVSVDITPFQTVIMDNDNASATFAATDANGSSVFDITGGTGAQVVDTSTRAARVGNTAQLLCLEYATDKFDAADTTVGLFMILENQFYA